MKVAVVTPIPTPYRDPFWNEVARQPGIELHVFYCSAGKQDRPWEVSWSREYYSEILPGRNLMAWRGSSASCFWNPCIVQRLAAGKYDALVVSGYNHLTMLAAMRYVVQQHVPYFLTCESHVREPRRFWRRWLKHGLVRKVITRAAGGFPTGTLARDYLLYYGADPRKLALIPNVPDVLGLAQSADRLQAIRGRLRREHGLADHRVVLFAGRLIPMKRADALICAFRDAAPEDDTRLIILGDGPETSALKELVSRFDLQTRVQFAGFVQPVDMPQWYAMADLFVLPSSEPWGVVVLESLASGVPVIVTDEVGCYPDVINAPSVGTVVPIRNHEKLVDAIQRRIKEPISREAIVRAWAPVRSHFEYSTLARRMVELLQDARNYTD
ncbi:MAG: glycosyltransferase family 4 protein [Candidatus Nealsonbacteria bacterium]|nr:glycosyltransferase family 4 protein [Candidatus Nealsonbacteria bacterium]